mgnify:CR=1 FL=1
MIDKDESEKDRTEVQKTMLGPEVLDSEHHQEIVFKSTGAEPAGQGRWTVHGNLTLHGQTHPVMVMPYVYNENTGPSDGLVFRASCEDHVGIPGWAATTTFLSDNHLQLGWNSGEAAQVVTWLG